MAVGGLHHLGQVFAQGRLAAAKGEPVGIPANGGKGLVIFFYREIIIGSLPHITGFAARVTAITDTDGEIHGQRQRFAQRIRGLHFRYLG